MYGNNLTQSFKSPNQKQHFSNPPVGNRTLKFPQQAVERTRRPNSHRAGPNPPYHDRDHARAFQSPPALQTPPTTAGSYHYKFHHPLSTIAESRPSPFSITPPFSAVSSWCVSEPSHRYTTRPTLRLTRSNPSPPPQNPSA